MVGHMYQRVNSKTPGHIRENPQEVAIRDLFLFEPI